MKPHAIFTAIVAAICAASCVAHAQSWSLSGNAATSGNFLGTTNSVSLTIKVNNQRALLIQPGSSPNLIGGYSGNGVTTGVVGAVIGGGGALISSNDRSNSVTDDYGAVVGGISNRAGDAASTTSNASYAFVGGGAYNVAGRLASTIAGGYANRASGAYSFTGGGDHNSATGDYSAVGGGKENTSGSTYATISGGLGNTTSGTYDAIGGGYSNTAAGAAMIGGGYSNTATGSYSTVSGGINNKATNYGATVAGGYGNTASGYNSFAAGNRAMATHDGAFVWADSSNFDFSSTATNQFIVRATGGVRLVSAIDSTGTSTAGARLAAGSGSWSMISDRNLKKNITALDTASVLDRLMSVPIHTWSYKAQEDSIKHLGPMAQDFYGAFKLGESEEYISSVDADGVALAAIQALYKRLQEKEGCCAKMESELATVKQQNAALAARLAAIESQLAK